MHHEQATQRSRRPVVLSQKVREAMRDQQASDDDGKLLRHTQRQTSSGRAARSGSASRQSPPAKPVEESTKNITEASGACMSHHLV